MVVASSLFVARAGGFNIPIGPGFSPLRLVWLKELGACYVSASIRGGGEYGNDWHAGGKLFNKQNVFDDFCASAEHLISAGITTKGVCRVLPHVAKGARGEGGYESHPT